MNSKYLSSIRNVCQVINSLTDLNVFYIGTDMQIVEEIIINALPAFMSGTFQKNVIDHLVYPTENTSYIASVHTASNQLNYLSTPVLIQNEFSGHLIVGPYLDKETVTINALSDVSDKELSKPLRLISNQFYAALTFYDRIKIHNLAECIGSMLYTINTMSVKDTEVRRAILNEINIPSDEEERKEQNVILNFDDIEERYRKENLLLKAVERGNYHKAIEIVEQYQYLLQNLQRIPHNSLRSYKNMSIVLNTLLRKAVENGGVHPLYIDTISTKYSILIEKNTSGKKMASLNLDMIFDYCKLINELAQKDYSPFTRKLIEYIRLNINQELNLDILSKVVNTSPSNISKRFKKETGEFLIDYVNALRVDEAIQLIKSGALNITDVAYSIGFNDTSYFSKVFKKVTGYSPTYYKRHLT